MRPLLLLWVMASLAACDGGSADCTVTEGTGLFEIFKTDGCLVVHRTSDPSAGFDLDFWHQGDKVLVDGLDNISLVLPGRPYVGRRGSCFMSDSDVMQPVPLQGHCDYLIRDFTKVSETESKFTLELVDVYMEAYGNKGTLKAVLLVPAFDQGSGP